MEEKNELNDIILNKGTSANSNKKIILAVATLGIILIIVVMLMNSLSSSGTDNLPQAALPPQPQTQTVAQNNDEEPLFEDVEVEQDTPQPKSDAELTQIAQKLKKQSNVEEVANPVTPPKATPKKVVKTAVAKKESPKKAIKKVAKKTVVTHGKYYIQVGSFSKYKPNKKFLHSITNLGYHYSYHKVKSINKVLVGPFNSRQEATAAKRTLRAKVEPGAFLVKL